MAAIADYNTLVAEVKAYCARSDSTFSNRFPVFVALTEERIYNGFGFPGDPLYSAPLRSKIMEATVTVTITNGDGTLPDDYLEMRKITRDNDPNGMTYMPAEALARERVNTTSGLPLFYTTVGSTLQTAPSSSLDLSLSYYRRFDPVNTEAPTNDLITNHGLVYFNACMFEAFSFMQEPELALAWLARYRATIDGVNRVSLATRTGGRMRAVIRAIG